MKTKDQFESDHMAELGKYSMPFSEKVVIAKMLAQKDSQLQFYEALINMKDRAIDKSIEVLNIERGAI